MGADQYYREGDYTIWAFFMTLFINGGMILYSMKKAPICGDTYTARSLWLSKRTHLLFYYRLVCCAGWSAMMFVFYLGCTQTGANLLCRKKDTNILFMNRYLTTWVANLTGLYFALATYVSFWKPTEHSFVTYSMRTIFMMASSASCITAVMFWVFLMPSGMRADRWFDVAHHGPGVLLLIGDLLLNQFKMPKHAWKYVQMLVLGYNVWAICSVCVARSYSDEWRYAMVAKRGWCQFCYPISRTNTLGCFFWYPATFLATPISYFIIYSFSKYRKVYPEEQLLEVRKQFEVEEIDPSLPPI